MKLFNVAVIGCGRISYKGIEAVVNNKERLQLVSTCDPIEEKAIAKKNEYIDKLGKEVKVNIYKDYKEMLEKEDIDIVYVATESGYHPEIAINCMKKHIHVIVEKPMALSIKDADEMIACAKENNVKLCVSHQNRFNTAIQKLRSEVEANNFGKMVNGTARILWNRNMGYYEQAPWRGTYELDGGTLMNQCIHNIDLLQWMMCSDVDTVYAQCDTFLRDIDAEDFGAILIRFKNGAIGIIEGSACVYPTNLEETLSIFGEKAAVCIGGLAVNKIETWRIEGSEESEEKVLAAQEADPDSVYGFGHTLLFKDVVDSIIEDRQPLVSGEEAKKPLEIILAAYKSTATGMPVKFPLGDFSTMDMKEMKNK
ncbi:Gfo/Idh/MocA family oxidoreductase [Clostridium sp. UBA3887]|uniref:Gfo/Idh/MocA family protein n=1 Tax=Clostridium sp. UBA3887 TaxID=1946356 RepID=UPI00321798FE